MAEFEYKYIYLKIGDSYKQVMISDYSPLKLQAQALATWNSTTSEFVCESIIEFNPIEQTSLLYGRGISNLWDTRLDIYTRGNGLDYIDTGFSLYMTYTNEIDGIKNGCSLALYSDNVLIQRYALGDGNFNIFIASTYNENRNIVTARVVTYDMDSNEVKARYPIDTTFKNYLNNIASTNPDKRYYEYDSPELINKLKSTNFIISDIPEIALQDDGWNTNGLSYNYLKGDNTSGWVVSAAGTEQVSRNNFAAQSSKFNEFYHSQSEDAKLGSNFLYYNTGVWLSGLHQYSDTWTVEQGDEYFIRTGNLKVRVKISDIQYSPTSVIEFYRDDSLLDTFTFRLAQNSDYGGYADRWSTQNITDSLFLGRVGDDFYIFGRSTQTNAIRDGDGGLVNGPAYIKRLHKLNYATAEVIKENMSTTEGSAEGYGAYGKELAGNESSERGVDDEGNEGTWVDTDNDGTVDTFIPDIDRDGSGERGGNDGSKDLKDGDGNVAGNHDLLLQPTLSGLFNMYILNDTEFTQFSNELMTPNAWRKFKDFFSVNPLDGIYSLSIMPIYNTQNVTSLIKIADWTTVNAYKKLLNTTQTVHFGERMIKETYPTMEFLNYTDVSVKIYLPFIGYKDLDVVNVMGVTTELTYNINYITGDILATLYCDGKPLYNWQGNCMLRIPLSKTDYTNAINSGISAVASVASSVVGFATDNPMLGVSGIVGAVSNTLKATKPDLKVSGTISGSPTIFMPRQPFFLITRNTLAFDKEFNHEFGRHSYLHKQIGKLEGFTKIVDVDMKNFNCTEDEKEEIANLLRSGVYVYN